MLTQSALLASLVPVYLEMANVLKETITPHCAVVRQASQSCTALSSLYRSIFAAVHRPPWTAVRYVGVFTDGGADKALRRHAVDNMCAPVAPSYVQRQLALECPVYVAHTCWYAL